MFVNKIFIIMISIMKLLIIVCSEKVKLSLIVANDDYYDNYTCTFMMTVTTIVIIITNIYYMHACRYSNQKFYSVITISSK